MIACDTSSLSQFFRRQKAPHNGVASAVEKLINSNRIALFGIVRQELLSGVKHPEQFRRIETSTRALPLHFAGDEDHVTAANFFNACRAKGVQGSPVDFLICAMAARRKFALYATDPDFALYESIIPIKLYKPKTPNFEGSVTR